MGQINTTNAPQYLSDPTPPAINSRASAELAWAGPLPGSEIPQDDLQLTKLSGVLNSLKKGATAMRSQVAQVMASVRGGTYQVDPIQVSRSIVGESLASR
jgi:hypothetical protein